MEQPGPHDRAIGKYLDEIGVVVTEHPDTIRRRQGFGFALSRELEKLEGESFVVIDGDGDPVGIAVVAPAAGLTIVSLEPDQKLVAVRAFGRLTSLLLSKTRPIDDGDLETPYLLTMEHELLPSKSVVYDAHNKDALDHAHEAFAAAFRPLGRHRNAGAPDEAELGEE